MSSKLCGWVVAVAALAALGGMALTGFGANGASVPKAVAAADAPPATCVNGKGDLGDTYYPGSATAAMTSPTTT